MQRGVLIKIGATVLCAASVACMFGGCKDKKEQAGEYAPTSSLTVTEQEVAALGEQIRVKLYFTDKDGTMLFTENRLSQFTAQDRKTENLAKKICELLSAGPADKDVYVNTLPKDSVVRSVCINGDVATVDFNSSFTENLPKDAAKLDLMMCALANTLTELKDINSVTVTVDNKPLGKTETGFEFKATQRNVELISVKAASIKANYNEEAFSDVALE